MRKVFGWLMAICDGQAAHHHGLVEVLKRLDAIDKKLDEVLNGGTDSGELQKLSYELKTSAEALNAAVAAGKGAPQP